ncbi:MAG: GNAT family N-acetyltransferase [Spirochaetaceae bacterium]|jgi:ribosomal protein S18 acetylase RimI-like enzyme|nr:GNAT family N-acetyltransferase [Spirochaetaceae bacterium]
MNIRTMTIADYDGLISLWRSTPGMGLNMLDDSRHGIERYIKRNPNTCFVAEDNGELVGAILSGHDGRRGFIYHTALASAHRRAGIGTRLVNAALEALENEGINKVALVAFKKNREGNIFWEKNGFSVRNDLLYRNKIIHDVQRIDT